MARKRKGQNNIPARSRATFGVSAKNPHVNMSKAAYKPNKKKSKTAKPHSATITGKLISRQQDITFISSGTYRSEDVERSREDGAVDAAVDDLESYREPYSSIRNDKEPEKLMFISGMSDHKNTTESLALQLSVPSSPTDEDIVLYQGRTFSHRNLIDSRNARHQMGLDRVHRSQDQRSSKDISFLGLLKEDRRTDSTFKRSLPNLEVSHHGENVAATEKYTKNPQTFVPLGPSRLSANTCGPDSALEFALANTVSGRHYCTDKGNLSSCSSFASPKKENSGGPHIKDSQASPSISTDFTDKAKDRQPKKTFDKKIPDVTCSADYSLDEGLGIIELDTTKTERLGLLNTEHLKWNGYAAPYAITDVAATNYEMATIISHRSTGIVSEKSNYLNNYSFDSQIKRRDELQSSALFLKRGRCETKRDRSNQDWPVQGVGIGKAENSLSDEVELADNAKNSPTIALGWTENGYDQLDMSDSDLEATLVSQWKLDRNKKSIRKKEREELRKLGLLGRKSKIKNIKKKSFPKSGLQQEVQLFLSSSKQSQPFPPLGHAERKYVHELAHAVGLKSRSIGKGDSRHPVLYKTIASLNPIDDVSNLHSKQFRKFRCDYARKQQFDKGPNKVQQKRASNRVAVGYREGEIVGAAAPELAAENIGNKLIRKLGWTPGEGLGALNNKGILQPVTHVVKNSRSGLR